MYKTKYLYVYSNDPDDWRDEPLYIGQQARFDKDFTRHFEHLCSSDRQCILFRDIKYLYVALLLNSYGINDLEHFLIEKYNPPMNSVFTSRNRGLPPSNTDVGFMNDSIDSLVWVRFDTDSLDKSKVYGLTKEALYEYYNQRDSIKTVDTMTDYLKYIVTIPDKDKDRDVYVKNGNFYVSFIEDKFYTYSNILNKRVIYNSPLINISYIYTLNRKDIDDDLKFVSTSDYDFMRSDYIRTCDKSLILSKSSVMKDRNRFVTEEKLRLKLKIEGILASLFPVSRQRINKESGVNTLLHILNKETVDGENVIHLLCDKYECYSEGDYISKTDGKDINFIYPHPIKPYTMVTDIFTFSRNKWVYVKSLESYKPKEEDVYLRVSGDGSWIKIHFSYHDDESYTPSITKEGINTLLSLYRNKVIPLCKEINYYEPEFSTYIRLIDFVEDFETGEIISEEDTYALAKFGNGYNVRNHNLIFYKLGGLLRAYSFSRKNGLLYASFDNIPEKRCAINGKIYSTITLGLFDFLDFVDSTETREIINDMRNLTISRLVEKYNSI